MNLGDQQNVHPFFTKPQRELRMLPDFTLLSKTSPGQPSLEHADDPDSAPTDAPHQDENQPIDGEATKLRRPRGRPPGSKSGNGKRKSGESNAAPKVKQASLVDFTKGSIGQKKAEETPRNVIEATSLEGDPNFARRKRQKTTSPKPEQLENNSVVVGNEVVNEEEEEKQDGQLSWIQQLETEAEKEPEQVEVEASSPDPLGEQPNVLDSDIVPNTSPRSLECASEVRKTPVPPSSPPITHSSPAKSQSTPKKKVNFAPSSPSGPSPPKKMLRINAKGRFSSPVSKDIKDESGDVGHQRKTRSRGSKKQPKQLIVKISYINDDERAVQMAEDIDEILSGIKRAPDLKPSAPLKPSEPPKSQKPAKPAGPPKPTHPFFSGKPGPKDNSAKGDNVQIPPTASSVKPAGRRETAITPGKLRAQARTNDDTPESSGFGAFGNSTKPRRALGGAEAPWPWKGVTRVGDEEEPQYVTELSSDVEISELPFKERRKFKGLAYQVPEAESLISCFSHELHNGIRSQQGENVVHDSAVRLPQRLLTTGSNIQRRVKSQTLGGKSFHPTLPDLFEGIATTLTPFDRGVCETLPWSQKYSPKRAADVLGSAMEVSVLRRWLESLTVNAVGVSGKELGKGPRSKKDGAAKPPKKKRKKDELDDFIISDEDGLGELDELTDPDDSSRPSSSHGTKKSMVRFGGDGASIGGGKKLHNLTLLSGPHGSGKTAAVYAVAKELGFEVFEINPGSRRSGKDVLDKIGDMTENHLVQRQARDQPEQPVDDSDAERLSDAVQKDIESGRQKSMSSFFKPVSEPKPKPEARIKKGPETKIAKDTSQPTLGKPKQSQKQSLILLEEVDVLFEDDKNFWQTVEYLAVHSRRPIVMTCTEENLVRMDESSLHAILRMTPAPTDLATDYLLLLAAKEGHLLHRNAVSDLYESKNHDLRASIMELDFWCQMAVGDHKGGLEWMYQRWPPGKDVDEHGQKLRVASENTYTTGMGWVGHDVMLEENNVGFDKEYELVLELTESWNIEPAAYSSGPGQGHQIELEQSGQQANLEALQNMERLMDLSSAADVYCRVGVPTRNQVSRNGPSEHARVNVVADRNGSYPATFA